MPCNEWTLSMGHAHETAALCHDNNVLEQRESTPGSPVTELRSG